LCILLVGITLGGFDPSRDSLMLQIKTNRERKLERICDDRYR